MVPSGNNSVLRAIGLMLIAMCLIPIGDTAGKLLANRHQVEVWFIAWSRFLLGFLVVLVMTTLWSSGRPAGYLKAAKDYRVWLRGTLIACAICAILTSLKTEPIANVFAAFFVGPIVAYIGAALLLKEQVTLGRTLLLLTGFVGVLLVVRPGFGDGFGIYFALLAGFFYGCFLVTTRWLANLHPSNTLLLSQLAIGSTLLTPLGLQSIPVFQSGLPFNVVSLVFVSALGSAGGNVLLLIATRHMDASKLAPLVYFQLVAATILGIWVFGDAPDWIAWLGIVTIIVAGGSSFLLRTTSTINR